MMVKTIIQIANGEELQEQKGALARAEVFSSKRFQKATARVASNLVCVKRFWKGSPKLFRSAQKRALCRIGFWKWLKRRIADG